MDKKVLKERLELACRWITDVAQVKDEALLPNERRRHLHKTWSGAVRGEYRVSTRQWDYFCPVWHTGQAVKALTMAADFVGPFAMEGAKAGGEFILTNAIREGEDRGLILAHEDDVAKVNTSAILECLDGLLHLGEATKDARFQEAALAALEWVAERAYIHGKGLFLDCYDPATRQFVPERYGSEGRPLLDDAVFVKGYRLSDNPLFSEIAEETAARLLQDEEPSGNWINYAPCNAEVGYIHPRHAYWWGSSLLEVHRMTGDPRFREAFDRSVWWYAAAMRRDGGIFRNTYREFNTDSFGHATSGVGCAVSMFLDFLAIDKSEEVLPYIEMGLNYCLRVQFTKPSDANLKGAILEKVLPPDGTDASPYYIRDLGTIFFIQAASKYLAAGLGDGAPVE